jgi:NAD(P)-dependent dehydrogenase (short-subunit alcohol dehydrogenase family)
VSPPPAELLGALLKRDFFPLHSRTKKILDDNPDLQKQWTSLIPQGKMGQPEDLMGAVTFLCSDASGYVTGAFCHSAIARCGAQIMATGGTRLAPISMLFAVAG